MFILTFTWWYSSAYDKVNCKCSYYTSGSELTLTMTWIPVLHACLNAVYLLHVCPCFKALEGKRVRESIIIIIILRLQTKTRLATELKTWKRKWNTRTQTHTQQWTSKHNLEWIHTVLCDFFKNIVFIFLCFRQQTMHTCLQIQSVTGVSYIFKQTSNI